MSWRKSLFDVGTIAPTPESWETTVQSDVLSAKQIEPEQHEGFLESDDQKPWASANSFVRRHAHEG